jgi:hypothetical protein
MYRQFVDRVLVDHQLLSHSLADLLNLRKRSRFRDETLVKCLLFPTVIKPSSVSSHNFLEAELSANFFRGRVDSSQVNKNTLFLPCLRVKGDLMLRRNNNDILYLRKRLLNHNKSQPYISPMTINMWTYQGRGDQLT